MNIEFTSAQYEKLIKMAYLGEWMINSYAIGEESKKEYEELLSHILSFASKEGLEKFVFKDPASGQCDFSNELFDDPEVCGFIDKYNEDTFWAELAHRLVDRDFLRKYKLEERKKMTKEDFIEKTIEIERTYNKEFETHGLQNLEIKK